MPFGVVWAQLSVQDPTVYGTKPGYIDRTTLVVEPHGAYVEQALYIWYSDHNQYPGNQNLEIVHRFTLPQGSVINDLWLWIGNEVVKAKMFDTWTARHIYDSIVVHRHDPAFLAKNGNSYELHIYPLVSGQFRKIRMNFITPTSWTGNSGFADMPLSFLQASNSTTKPVQLLFRDEEDVWGSPYVRELPNISSERTVDTAGYAYRDFELPDISSLESFSLGFQTAFTDGIYCKSGDRQGDSSYFQIGVDPASFNVVRSDTGAARVIVGIDLSGYYSPTLSSLVPRITATLHNALRPVDQFCLTISGAGSITHYSPWRLADSVTIDTVLKDFLQSTVASKLSQFKRPVVIFCDDHAQTIWRFPGLDSIAIIKTFGQINDAVSSIPGADIVASYDHGFETAAATNSNLSVILPKIDSLFYRGGRFLGYYDHNRPAYEMIESHYINGLGTNAELNSVTLFPQPNGNIGNSFPSSVTCNSVNFLTFSDPDTKIDLASSSGAGAVISKRIGNGLLVVSGIWSFTDDEALKEMLAIPLLGTNQHSWDNKQPIMLQALLDDFRTSIAQDSVAQVIFFSNADSLISTTDARTWVNTYLTSLGTNKPIFNTVNLLDGNPVTPAYVTDNGVDYYGSGFLLNSLAQVTGGEHFESHLRSWDYIEEGLKYTSCARMDSMKVGVVVDNGAGNLIQIREVAPDPGNRGKPWFYIGVSNAAERIDFNVQAWFYGFTQSHLKQASTYLFVDTTNRSPILAGMMGWETLQDYFLESSFDTSKIVNLAIKYNLLCDYTSLIALEPSESNPPLLNPFDESGIFTSMVRNKEAERDSSVFSAFPNPFNGQVKFFLNLKRSSSVRIIIYNILGQQVRAFTLIAGPGTSSITWDGADSHEGAAASGVYLVQATVIENATGTLFRKNLKILMLK